tara:strand:- start:197 stop:499 length:303 start_codon:yes stop_codon:yes gene_type:complete
MSDEDKKDFVKLNTDQKKKEMMNDFELAVAKSMTQTKLDPLGSAAVLLKLALTVYHEHLKDKYAVEEVIFHALKTIDGDWFDDQVDDILNDLYIGDKTIH